MHRWAHQPCSASRTAPPHLRRRYRNKRPAAGSPAAPGTPSHTAATLQAPRTTGTRVPAGGGGGRQRGTRRGSPQPRGGGRRALGRSQLPHATANRRGAGGRAAPRCCPTGPAAHQPASTALSSAAAGRGGGAGRRSRLLSAGTSGPFPSRRSSLPAPALHGEPPAEPAASSPPEPTRFSPSPNRRHRGNASGQRSPPRPAPRRARLIGREEPPQQRRRRRRRHRGARKGTGRSKRAAPPRHVAAKGGPGRSAPPPPRGPQRARPPRRRQRPARGTHSPALPVPRSLRASAPACGHLLLPVPGRLPGE